MTTQLDDELTAISALRAAQLLLAQYVEPGPRDSERTIQTLLDVLDCDEVVEATDRLEDAIGLRSDAVAVDD
jgi:hypothetical protein